MPKGIPGSHPPCTAPGCSDVVCARDLCDKHYDRWRRTGSIEVLTPEKRFFSHILEVSPGCWQWDSPGLNGYGRLHANGSRQMAHRWSYEHFIGPIPRGFQVDHRCHNEDPTCAGGTSCQHRRCVNPAHLELATQRENVLRGKGPSAMQARQVHCQRGHSFDEANTIRERGGKRRCRACKRARERK